MKLLAIVMTLMAMGCMGFHEKRLEKIDSELNVLNSQLLQAQLAGDGPKEKEIRKKIQVLETEQSKESLLAEKDADSRRLLWLAVLGVVTGGIKLATDMGKKVLL